jgi:arsenate reductase-like glutaredoxin family protein
MGKIVLKGKYALLVYLLSVSITISFTANSQTREDVCIYSSSSCGFTKATVEWLEKNNIPFVFKCVDEAFGPNDTEMSEVVVNAGFATSFYYPVMLIKGRIVMRPSIDQLIKALNGVKVTGLEERMEKHQYWRPAFPKSMTYSYDDVRSRVKDGDVIIYTDNSKASNDLVKELKEDKIPYKEISAMPGTKEYITLRQILDDISFVPVTYFPVACIRGIWIMNTRGTDVRLMLIQSLGD